MRALPQSMQFKVFESYFLSDAEPRTDGQRIEKIWQIRPNISIKLSDGQKRPITARPLGRRLFKLRSALSTPGAEEWPLFRDTQSLLQIIRGKHIVIVNEYDKITARLMKATQSRLGKAEFR